MQHTRDHVQQHRDSWVNVGLDDLPTAAQPTLSLFELAFHTSIRRPLLTPARAPGGAQAVVLGEGYG